MSGVISTLASKPLLPIDALLPEIVSSLRQTPNLVIEAAPGAGKTTRVPPALLTMLSGQVIVLEPRRIAARLAARRTASELGEEAGETVGFQVRFEEAVGPRTRLRFVTEGVLTRRMLSDPDLRGVDAVVLDEFHERHLDTDLGLALLKRLQERRPELRILVMSATLDTGPVAAFLGNCPVLRSEGRAFELAIRYTPYSAERLEVQVRAALERLLHESPVGHVLVFLPGAAEIRRALRECEDVGRRADAVLLPLHGDLSPAEQDLAVGPSRQRKVIFSTNVAESSVTIEGVTVVIDSGLARFAAYSPWSGLPTLTVERISKASAAQRAGRAGRTGPGVAVRLYALGDFAQRRAHDVPEILRGDLSGLCLALRAMEIGSMHELDWLETPPEAAILHAETLLDRLGATVGEAHQFVRYPVPPRLARILVEAAERNVVNQAIAAVALLGSGARSQRIDLLEALDLPPDERTLQQRRQLQRMVRSAKQAPHDDDSLLISVLTGFSDRVARLRAGLQVALANGLSVELAGERPRYEFMVVLDAEDRKDKQAPIARLTSRIEPEWLLDLFPDRLREEVRLDWNRTAERVEAVSLLWYDQLVIEETRGGRPAPAAATALLLEKALELGMERFVDADAWHGMLARYAFAGLPAPEAVQELASLCEGLVSFSELRQAAQSLIGDLEARAGGALRDAAPTTIRLPGGRLTKVHYEEGKPPWIASRLQDFFGMRDTPRIGRDKTPVVVHLLAPNQRAVQTTTDLAGFWQRLYPQVRRELMRRYPRHAWPEDPLSVAR